jgi:GNAT superfamily N-acetyltransferase
VPGVALRVRRVYSWRVMRKRVTIHHLEMTEAPDPGGSSTPPADLRIHRAETPCPELNRFFYAAVGGAWYWIDRLGWSYARWMKWLSRPEVETWVASSGGNPAGYFELERQPGDQVELVYFGLLPQFIGKGIGGALLDAAIRRAWEMGAKRVWVHTCSLDHPRALEAYQRHGFRVFKEELAEPDLPDRTPGPWPGWEGKSS